MSEFVDQLDAVVHRTERTHAAAGIDTSTCYLCRGPVGDGGNYCLHRGLSVLTCSPCWEASDYRAFERWLEGGLS